MLAFVSTERMLSERQVDFDIVSEDALAEDLKAGAGFFETLSGSRYSVVILPGEVVLSERALGRLRAFAAGGGRVLFLGHLPTMISGRTFLEARAASAADFSWAKVAVAEQLAATPTPPAEAPKSAPEAQVVPASIAEAVASVVGVADVSVDSKTVALRVMKRRLKDSDVYVFFNEGAAAIAPTVTFQNDAQLVEEWDTSSGSVASTVSMRDEPGKTIAVKLDLKPYEVRVLMLR